MVRFSGKVVILQTRFRVLQRYIVTDMNGFQEKLSVLVSEFERAGRRVCESEGVSRIDVDVLREKIRQMYDFLLSSEWDEARQASRVLPVTEEPVAERAEAKAEEPKIETPFGENESAEEKNETPKEKNESAIRQELEQVIENEEPEIIEQDEEQEEEKEIFVQEETEARESEKEETPEEEETLAAEDETPEQKPEESRSGHSSVLSYLHHNIMKDDEPKPKQPAGTTLDLFAEKAPSIAERFESRTRSDLRTAIGVSEKFMFINDLFSGNLKEYTDFINKLNDVSTWDMSKLLIEETRQKKKWAAASLAYTSLLDLIRKRFEK